MARADGKLVKNLSYFYKLIPHLQTKRYDATNFVKVDINITNALAYIKSQRKLGKKLGLMDIVIAAFSRIIIEHPELNRFIMNKKIYQRNHVAISFVVIKEMINLDVDETAVKVYPLSGDNIFSITEKTRRTIKANEVIHSKNAMDIFVNRLMSTPFLPGFFVKIIKLLDLLGLLPRKIIDISPFHTSLFVSNMASLNMSYVFHHLYDFGTTSIFASMGKPERSIDIAGNTCRIMALGISTDERICAGAVFTRCFFDLRNYIENPQLLEEPFHDTAFHNA